MQQWIGVETGGTKIQIVLGTSDGEILLRKRYAVERSHGAEGIRQNVERALREILAESQPSGIGMGFGGPIDFRAGCAARSFHIEGWNDFPLRTWLEKITGLPAAVDNDCNVAALGEARRGAGRNKESLFYTTLGSGMGGGLIVRGEIYHGLPPGEAEIGLMCFDQSGVNTESQCCGWAVDRKIRERIKLAPDGKLARLTTGMEQGQSRHLWEAVQAGDPIAHEILDETTRNIGFALSHVAHLLNPEVFIVGGGLSLIGEPLRAGIEKHLRHFLNPVFRTPPKVCLAELGEDTVIVGALFLAQTTRR